MTVGGDIRIPSRQEVLERLRNEGWRIAAVLPYHYPRALLRALKVHPVEIWGPAGIDPSAGNRHFQAYTCAIVRNATSLLLGDAGRLVDLVLVPHNCDALQGMGSVLRDFAGLPIPVLSFYPPKSRTAADLPYLVEELKSLASRLEQITGESIDEGAVRDAIKREAEADLLFARLAANRNDFDVGDRIFYSTLRAREYLPIEGFLELAGRLRQGAQNRNGVRIFLSGIVPEPMSLFDQINDLGARIVGDDMACGSRRSYRYDLVEPDSWVALARSLLELPPDPLTGAPIGERIDYLDSRLRQTSADGLLVYDVKFCEPELFDLPRVRQGLVERGFPVLHVEHEMGRELPAQLLTRIEAFVEMLR